LIVLEKRRGLLPGFSDPVLDSQFAFRAVLGAMSYPGRISMLDVGLVAPEPLHPASAAVALALLDFETPLWTDLPFNSEGVDWIRFHCGCPLAEEPAAGRFALIIGDPHRMPLENFFPGTDESPGDSSTLIIQVGGLAFGKGRKLTGPGIEEEHFLEVEGMPEGFWRTWKANYSRYPLGVDLILTAGEVLAALPRTTLVE
jgi:alpha-D-ribose 1-methylphosphonate 5-triphosphate synthase subunit PhnH